jgi:hypothetical protein
VTRGALTNITGEAHHTFSPWVGQRSATFRFELVDGTTGQFLGELHPTRGASLTHDTTRTIKRSLQLSLGAADTAAVNPVRDRIDVYMVFNQEEPHEHPLGRYMFVDNSRQLWTSGRLSDPALVDEMFIVDQALERGLANDGKPVETLIRQVMADSGSGLGYTLESSPYVSAEAFRAGMYRGQVLESLALTGDYFSPWVGNDRHLHFIRAFDPAKRVPDFDFDTGAQVYRNGIIETDDLLTAPNRFVVISNAATDPSLPVVGTADVLATAPHSIANRGFVVTSVNDLQVTDNLQATAVATNLAIRKTVFERVSLSTPPDPRHDSYNVVRWQGELWLELAWSMALMEGGQMNHLLRKAYT